MKRALLALALASCSKQAPRHDFVAATYPGFTLDVPQPLGSPPASALYDRGETEWKSASAVYSVSWSLNPLPSAAIEKTFIAGLETLTAPKKVVASSRIRVNQQEALRIDFGAGGDFWSFVTIGCGVRTVQLMVHAKDRGEQTLQRMLSTFTCSPDATKEKPLAALAPAGLDDPSRLAGWKREPSPDGYVIGDATGDHAITFVRGDGDAEDLALLRTMLPTWKFGAASTTTVGGRPRHWIEATSDEGLPGIGAAWACDQASGVIALAINYTPDEGRAFLGAFRCPRPGDKPLVAE